MAMCAGLGAREPTALYHGQMFQVIPESSQAKINQLKRRTKAKPRVDWQMLNLQVDCRQVSRLLLSSTALASAGGLDACAQGQQMWCVAVLICSGSAFSSCTFQRWGSSRRVAVHCSVDGKVVSQYQKQAMLGWHLASTWLQCFKWRRSVLCGCGFCSRLPQQLRRPFLLQVVRWR